MPEPITTVEEEVIQKIKLRRIAGLKKYGTSMERTDLTKTEWLIHAQEEAMDLAVYLQRLIRDEQRIETNLAPPSQK